MANTGFKGINVRQTGNQLIFDGFLQDSAGALITSGTTTVKLYELQSDGTLKSYDFNDNTFKTTALTTATLALTHRTGNNSTTNTGYWSAALSTLTGFTIGSIYLALVNNTGASPTDQLRKFQYGGGESDIIVSGSYPEVDVEQVGTNAVAATRLRDLFKASLEGTVDTATLSASTSAFETSFTVDSSATYLKQGIYFVTGANAGITAQISSYSFTHSKVQLGLTPALPSAPANTDTFLIFGKIGI